jgi:hypothetical protein
LTVAATPTLHVPDEPIVRAHAWLAAVLAGSEWDDVLSADDGLIAWLWSRWSSLRSAGVTQEAFARIALEYRRELWLWLAGERTWAQACSGLVGRVYRRMTSAG